MSARPIPTPRATPATVPGETQFDFEEAVVELVAVALAAAAVDLVTVDAVMVRIGAVELLT